MASTINYPSHIHHSENSKPRLAESQYDFLFNTGRGHAELYEPDVHGQWEIIADGAGKLSVRQHGLPAVGCHVVFKSR